MTFLSAFLLALFITMGLIPVFRRLARLLGAMDLPDARKVHSRPVARTGGLAMAAGAFVPVFLWCSSRELLTPLLAGTGIIVFFGFVDDLKAVGYRTKFAAQLAAALIVVLYGGVKIQSLGMLLPDEVLLPDWISIPLTIFVILGVTNAINLSDGLDGLAGGISALSLGCIGVLAYQVGNAPIALVCAASGGAILAFLRYNTYPAAVFMGDAGSQFLGFVTIILALSLTQSCAPLSPLLPVIILGFPVLDTVSVLAERMAQGKSPFLADQNHFHHKLMRLGMYQPDAVRLIYLLQGLLVAAAYALRFHSDWLLLVGYMAFFALVAGGVLAAEASGWRIREYNRLVKAAKNILQEVRDRGLLVRLVFLLDLWGFLGILLLSCVIPAGVPFGHVLFSAFIAVFVLCGWLLAREWKATAAKLALYLLIPLMVYHGEMSSAPWVTDRAMHLYDLSIGVLVVLALLVVRFSRRRTFRTTPLDLLVLFIAVVVPFVSENPHHIGIIAAKIIGLFFVCEVLMAELRCEVNWVVSTTFAVLGTIAMRGLLLG